MSSQIICTQVEETSAGVALTTRQFILNIFKKTHKQNLSAL